VEAIVMSADQADVVRARSSLRDLTAAVERLRQSRPDSLDMRRLVEDVARVATDLDLAVGPSQPRPEQPVHVIPDHEYDPNLFADADDEGVGPRRQ
jgi:hypothetical protein